MLCCGYTLTDFPISIRLSSLALWRSNDCPSASKATLMNMDKYIMWIHYERLHNHNKAKHNKAVCIFLGIYCTYADALPTAKFCSLLWDIVCQKMQSKCQYMSINALDIDQTIIWTHWITLSLDETTPCMLHWLVFFNSPSLTSTEQKIKPWKHNKIQPHGNKSSLHRYRIYICYICLLLNPPEFFDIVFLNGMTIFIRNIILKRVS